MAVKDLKIAKNNPTIFAVTAAMVRSATRVTVPPGKVRRELLAIAINIENVDQPGLQSNLSGLQTTCGWNKQAGKLP